MRKEILVLMVKLDLRVPQEDQELMECLEKLVLLGSLDQKESRERMENLE